jgi:hypothetical protein
MKTQVITNWQPTPHPFESGKWAVSRINDRGQRDHIDNNPALMLSGVRAFEARSVARIHADSLNHEAMHRATKAAEEAGYTAAKNNAPRSPALCPTLREMMYGLAVGEGVPFSYAWLNGFDMRVNEEANALLQDDIGA